MQERHKYETVESFRDCHASILDWQAKSGSNNPQLVIMFDCLKILAGTPTSTLRLSDSILKYHCEFIKLQVKAYFDDLGSLFVACKPRTQLQ